MSLGYSYLQSFQQSLCYIGLSTGSMSINKNGWKAEMMSLAEKRQISVCTYKTENKHSSTCDKLFHDKVNYSLQMISTVSIQWIHHYTLNLLEFNSTLSQNFWKITFGLFIIYDILLYIYIFNPFIIIQVYIYKCLYFQIYERFNRIFKNNFDHTSIFS